MPSKQQKRVDKAEQKQLEKQNELNKIQQEKDWDNGTNKRGLLRAQQQNDKHEEKMRNAKERKELLIEEEISFGPGKKSKSRKDKSGDLFMLNQALAAAPKTKAQKETESKMKKKEEQKKMEEQRKIEKEELLQKQLEEEQKLLNKNIVNNDILMTNIDNNDNNANSIDDAINMLNSNEEELSKEGFKEFYKNNFQQLKEDYPGLRLTQYKERIYKLWKKNLETSSNK